MKRYGFSNIRTVEAQYRIWKKKKKSNPKGIDPIGNNLFKVRIGYKGKSKMRILSSNDRISYRGKGIWSEAS